MSDEPDSIAAEIEMLVGTAGSITATDLARALGVSRQTSHRRLRELVKAGRLIREGQARATRYRLPGFRARFAPAGVDEAEVCARALAALTPSVRFSPPGRTRFEYAFTELLNNALDHAEAGEVVVEVEPQPGGLLLLRIEDDGVGAFARIRQRSDVADRFEAIVELSKGKLTTAPEHHSGEGLFFVSKVARHFRLEAQGAAWIVDDGGGDQGRADEGIGESPVTVGTRVTVLLDPQDPRPLEEVFRPYTEDFAFTKTRAHVRLLEYGTRLLSRSQAKRLVARLTEFTEVELDFTEVIAVGQGFVDEVFRVFAHAHPETRLLPTHMNEAVTFMVRRGLR